jgi:hypothetical protein
MPVMSGGKHSKNNGPYEEVRKKDIHQQVHIPNFFTYLHSVAPRTPRSKTSSKVQEKKSALSDIRKRREQGTAREQYDSEEVRSISIILNNLFVRNDSNVQNLIMKIEEVIARKKKSVYILSSKIYESCTGTSSQKG